MKVRTVLIGVILLLMVLSGYAAAQDPVKAVGEMVFGKKYTSYEQVQEDVNKLLGVGEYAKAVEILESVEEQFPENLADTLVNLSYLYRKTKEYEKAYDLYTRGVEKDVLFEIDRKIWANFPKEKFDRFQAVNKKNNLLRARYQLRAKPKYEIVEPDGYSADKKWPLLIVLHNNNGTIETARKRWRSEILNKEYLVAYLQSSFVQTSTGFSWRQAENRQKEIDRLYKKIIVKYPNIDTKRVYIGAFSAGGAMAMNMALRGEAPISGFIGACPARGREFEPEEVERGVQRGIKGVIIAGEKDRRTKKLKTKVMPSFEKGGLVCEFIVVPGLGHAIAENFPQQIADALKFLQGTGGK